MEFFQFKVRKMKTNKQLKKERIQEKIIWGYSPKGISNPQLSIELSLGGGVGLLDLEGLDEQTINNMVAECSDKLSKDNIWGVRITNPSHIKILNKFEYIPIIVVSDDLNAEIIKTITFASRWIIAEVCSFVEAQNKTDWADFFLVKGIESGGRIGENSSFILIQEFFDAGYPFLIQGGFGVFNIISALIGGALGVVLEEQLYLLPESPLTQDT